MEVYASKRESHVATDIRLQYHALLLHQKSADEPKRCTASYGRHCPALRRRHEVRLLPGHPDSHVRRLHHIPPLEVRFTPPIFFSELLMARLAGFHRHRDALWLKPSSGVC